MTRREVVTGGHIFARPCRIPGNMAAIKAGAADVLYRDSMTVSVAISDVIFLIWWILLGQVPNKTSYVVPCCIPSIWVLLKIMDKTLHIDMKCKMALGMSRGHWELTGGVGRFWAVWDHPMRFRLSTPKAPLMTPVVMWRPEQPLRVPPVPPRAVLFPSGTTAGPGRLRQGFGFCFVCDAKSADSFEQASEVIWVLKETPAEEQSGETEVSESLRKSSRPLHPPRELQGCELTLVFPAQSLSVCPRASKSTMPGPP